jgi:hypothetical protein
LTVEGVAPLIWVGEGAAARGSRALARLVAGRYA